LQLEEITAALGEVLRETEVFTREERLGLYTLGVALSMVGVFFVGRWWANRP